MDVSQPVQALRASGDNLAAPTPPHGASRALVVVALTLVLVVGALATAWFALGRRASDPAENLAGHIETAAALLDDNRDDPEQAVEALRVYGRDALPDAMESVGVMLQELHAAKRASQRRRLVEGWTERLQKPIDEFTEAWDGLEEALRDDDNAQAELAELEQNWEEFGRRAEQALSSHVPEFHLPQGGLIGTWTLDVERLVREEAMPDVTVEVLRDMQMTMVLDSDGRLILSVMVLGERDINEGQFRVLSERGNVFTVELTQAGQAPEEVILTVEGDSLSGEMGGSFLYFRRQSGGQ